MNIVHRTAFLLLIALAVGIGIQRSGEGLWGRPGSLHADVADFTLSQPSSLTLPQEDAGSVSFTIAPTAAGQGGEPVTLSVSDTATENLGRGLVTATVSPASVIPADGGSTATVYVTAPDDAAVGDHTMTVTATAGEISHTTTFTVSVTARVFSFTLNDIHPATFTMDPGTTSGFVVSVQMANHTSEVVALSAQETQTPGGGQPLDLLSSVENVVNSGGNSIFVHAPLHSDGDHVITVTATCTGTDACTTLPPQTKTLTITVGPKTVPVPPVDTSAQIVPPPSETPPVIDAPVTPPPPVEPAAPSVNISALLVRPTTLTEGVGSAVVAATVTVQGSTGPAATVQLTDSGSGLTIRPRSMNVSDGTNARFTISAPVGSAGAHVLTVTASMPGALPQTGHMTVVVFPAPRPNLSVRSTQPPTFNALIPSSRVIVRVQADAPTLLRGKGLLSAWLTNGSSLDKISPVDTFSFQGASVNVHWDCPSEPGAYALHIQALQPATRQPFSPNVEKVIPLTVASYADFVLSVDAATKNDVAPGGTLTLPLTLTKIRNGITEPITVYKPTNYTANLVSGIRIDVPGGGVSVGKSVPVHIAVDSTVPSGTYSFFVGAKTPSGFNHLVLVSLRVRAPLQ